MYICVSMCLIMLLSCVNELGNVHYLVCSCIQIAFIFLVISGSVKELAVEAPSTCWLLFVRSVGRQVNLKCLNVHVSVGMIDNIHCFGCPSACVYVKLHCLSIVGDELAVGVLVSGYDLLELLNSRQL